MPLLNDFPGAPNCELHFSPTVDEVRGSHGMLVR